MLICRNDLTLLYQNSKSYMNFDVFDSLLQSSEYIVPVILCVSG
jgi:hypothetical protein